MRKLLLYFSVLALLLLPSAALSDHIYKWVDENGITHFTDDPSKIPADQRENSALELHELPDLPDSQGVSQQELDDGELHGQETWELVCSRCHHAGVGEVDGRTGLGHLTFDSETKFPVPAERIVPRLKHATSGRRSDMDRLDISEKELLNLAKYLLEIQED